MYGAYEEEVLEDYKRIAALQGVNIGENLSPSVPTQSPGKQQDLIKFGKPEDYAKLPKKERRALTAQMKGLHQAIYEQTPFGKGKGRK
jgi:hypothetical protein